MKRYLPLAEETRPFVSTEIAAYHINRAPSTLRAWACLGEGPLKPRHIGGRLAWSVAQLRALLEMPE